MGLLNSKAFSAKLSYHKNCVGTRTSTSKTLLFVFKGHSICKFLSNNSCSELKVSGKQVNSSIIFGISSFSLLEDWNGDVGFPVCWYIRGFKYLFYLSCSFVP